MRAFSGFGLTLWTRLHPFAGAVGPCSAMTDCVPENHPKSAHKKQFDVTGDIKHAAPRISLAHSRTMRTHESTGEVPALIRRIFQQTRHR